VGPDTLSVIVLPDCLITMQAKEQLWGIIAHEMGHVKIPLDLTASLGALREHEYQADDFAVAYGYGHHLLKSLIYIQQCTRRAAFDTCLSEMGDIVRGKKLYFDEALIDRPGKTIRAGLLNNIFYITILH